MEKIKNFVKDNIHLVIGFIAFICILNFLFMFSLNGKLDDITETNKTLIKKLENTPTDKLTDIALKSANNNDDLKKVNIQLDSLIKDKTLKNEFKKTITTLNKIVEKLNGMSK